MPQIHYPWKRFWYPLSTEYHLSDRGYLSDPEGEYGHILNRDALSLEQLSNVPCLILLGEPGIGKSSALKDAVATLRFDLGDYQTDTSLSEDVFLNQDFITWERGTGSIVISLDSLDEGRVAIENIAVLLRELRKRRNLANRLLLRIACRTADWPVTLEEGNREI